MNKIIIVFSVFFLASFLFGCTQEEINPSVICLEGEVIGKIRTAGGGLAVSLTEPIDGGIVWKGEENVVELLNIPVQFTFPGTILYFQFREAKTSERGPISTDGDETINRILFATGVSDTGCKE